NHRTGEVVMISQGVIFNGAVARTRKPAAAREDLSPAGRARAWELVFSCVGDQFDGSARAGASRRLPDPGGSSPGSG
ncbi:MAG: hypothetical protein LC721_11860, partial [Actinobacteria bacterium]|nr:hypothetical protein [Actinomycetota bacterium]